MTCPKPDPRVSPQAVRRHFSGLRGPDLARLYMEVRYLLFGKNPRKTARELAEHDREHGEHLLLKI